MNATVSANQKRLCRSIIDIIEMYNQTKQSNFFYEGVSKEYLDVEKEFAVLLSNIMGELKFIITKYKESWYHIEKTSYDTDEKAFFVYEIYDMEEESAWN